MKLKSDLHGNTFIYRYMTFDKLCDLLINHRLFFCRSENLSDKTEITIPPNNIKRLEKYLSKTFKYEKDAIDQYRKDFKNQIKELRQHVFLNSWTKEEHESFLLWRAYTKYDQLGVRIAIRVGALKEALTNNGKIMQLNSESSISEKFEERHLDDYEISENLVVKLKEVEYQNFVSWNDLVSEEFLLNVENIVKNKIPPYRGENEVRFYVYSPYIKNNFYLYLGDNLDLESITISPFVPSWNFNTIKEVIQKLLNGQSSNVHQSTIIESV